MEFLIKDEKLKRNFHNNKINKIIKILKPKSHVEHFHVIKKRFCLTKPRFMICLYLV